MGQEETLCLIVEEFDQLPSCDHLLLWVIDARIPMNHLLRRINAFMTEALAFVHEQLDPYYSEIGRPSVDPELMIRMLIIGNC